MIYAEVLRVRRAFFIFAALVAAVALIIIISSQAAHSGRVFYVRINSDVPLPTHITRSPHASQIPRTPHSVQIKHGAPVASGTVALPLGVLFGVAGFLAIAFATVVATSLNRENERAGFVFTKPISRARLALTYMAVDLAAIVAAFIYALVIFCLVPVASIGRLATIAVQPLDIAIAFLGLGAAFLWYGVLQAVTAGYHGRGGKFIGFSWLAFLLLVVLASVQFGPIFHGIVMALNVVNPLAYFSGISSSVPGTGDVNVHSVFALPTATRAAITWCLAAAGCAIAIFAWKRVEV